MSNYGLSEFGFKAKDFPTIKKELEEELLAEVDKELRFTANSVVGQLTGIVSNQARQMWEMAAKVFLSLDTNTAEGRALESLCELTGTFRLQAAKSTASAEFLLDTKTTLPKGSRVRSQNGYVFLTDNEVTNSSADTEWVAAEITAEEYGPSIANPEEPLNIVTPVSGWKEARVLTDAIEGRYRESDIELRIRRITELRSTGTSSYGAIKSHLLGVPDVKEVFIDDSEGGIRAYVRGGEAANIAQALWQFKPVGVHTLGKKDYAITDSIGQERVMRFERPKEIPLRLFVKFRVTGELSEEDKVAIKTTIINYARKHFVMGAEVYPGRLYEVLIKHTKVLDIKTLRLTQLDERLLLPDTFDSHEIAVLDYQNIEIGVG